eukprot:gene11038-12870_t
MHGSMDKLSIRKNYSDANLRSAKERAASFSHEASIKDRSHSWSFQDHDQDNNVGTNLTDSPPPSTHGVTPRRTVSIAAEASPLVLNCPPLNVVEGQEEEGEAEDSYCLDDEQETFDEQAMQARYEIQTRNRAPTWDPTYPFSYPVGAIPSDTFSKVTHIADGSNSNIYTAHFQGQKVVIKMIKEGMETDPIALHEFDLEYGMLSRIKHPHVINILGAGYEPRRFMVLENLSGGSLNDLLAQQPLRYENLPNAHRLVGGGRRFFLWPRALINSKAYVARPLPKSSWLSPAPMPAVVPGSVPMTHACRRTWC